MQYSQEVIDQAIAMYGFGMPIEEVSSSMDIPIDVTKRWLKGRGIMLDKSHKEEEKKYKKIQEIVQSPYGAYDTNVNANTVDNECVLLQEAETHPTETDKKEQPDSGKSMQGKSKSKEKKSNREKTNATRTRKKKAAKKDSPKIRGAGQFVSYEDWTGSSTDEISCSVEIESVPEEALFNKDRHLCWQCQYRAKSHGDASSGKTKGPGCNYYVYTDIQRGCDVEVCNKFVKGGRIEDRKDEFYKDRHVYRRIDNNEVCI